MTRRSWEDIGVEPDGITLYDKRNGLPILPPSMLAKPEAVMALADACGVWLMLNHMREGQNVEYVNDFAPARAFAKPMEMVSTTMNTTLRPLWESRIGRTYLRGCDCLR